MCSNRKGSFFSGLLIGGLVGIVAGLVCTPNSGKNAKKKAEDVVHTTMDMIREKMDQLGDMVEKRRTARRHDEPVDDSEMAA